MRKSKPWLAQHNTVKANTVKANMRISIKTPGSTRHKQPLLSSCQLSQAATPLELEQGPPPALACSHPSHLAWQLGIWSTAGCCPLHCMAPACACTHQSSLVQSCTAGDVLARHIVRRIGNNKWQEAADSILPA